MQQLLEGFQKGASPSIRMKSRFLPFGKLRVGMTPIVFEVLLRSTVTRQPF
jgi:hypothetical protein